MSKEHTEDPSKEEGLKQRNAAFVKMQTQQKWGETALQSAYEMSSNLCLRAPLHNSYAIHASVIHSGWKRSRKRGAKQQKIEDNHLFFSGTKTDL